jgi:hypothetical protein
MSDERSGEKKRWLVRTWDVPTTMSGVNKTVEAANIEAQLNELAANDYDIHAVDLDQKLVVGRLDDEKVQSHVFATFGSNAPVQPQPTEHPSTDSSTEFELMGMHTTELLNNLSSVVAAIRYLPESVVNDRITFLAREFGRGKPHDEVVKSLDDIKRCHSTHLSHCSAGCPRDKVYAMVTKSLQDHLAANPLS